MIIGIDGNEANQKIRTGSGVYSLELLRQFKEFQISNFKFQIYLKDYQLEDMPKESENWRYKIVRPKKFWTQVGLPLKLWREKILGKTPDVFFTPSHYAPRFCPVPSVITIFDLSFIKYPEMFLKEDLYKLINWTKYSVRQAKKIITISQFSKQEIANHYKIDPEKIVVAYPGIDNEKFNIGIKNQELRIRKIKEKYKIDSNYIIYVGTIQPRKNLVRLVEAFKILKQVQNDKLTENLKLVIAGMVNEGRGGWMQEEMMEKIRNPKSEIRKNIILTGYVIDEDLPYLMVGANVLVLPSLYEGFGMPIMEAMASGIPVVASNTSSLPEVVGNAGILVDPLDPENMSGGIKEACYNNSRREEWINKGQDRVKIFNWERSAKIILDTLQSVTHDRN